MENKGYHYFYVRPRVDIIMKVEMEPNNPRDPFAMKRPSLGDILAELSRDMLLFRDQNKLSGK